MLYACEIEKKSHISHKGFRQHVGVCFASQVADMCRLTELSVTMTINVLASISNASKHNDEHRIQNYHYVATIQFLVE